MNIEAHTRTVVNFYDTHPINEQQILEKLALDGIELSTLNEDILQNYDMDHYDGVGAIDILAQTAGITATSHVLDVASGMGGPARYLAHNYGCRVTGIDLTESRVEGAKRLTELAGLSGLVTFQTANALENPFPDRTFDVVIGQEAWCHIPDKKRLIAEVARVTKAGGRIAFTDILEGSGLNAHDRDKMSQGMGYVDLATLAGYRDLLAAAGCEVVEAVDLSARWAEILAARLAMYRGLKAQTVAGFGEAVYRRWDDIYTLFVGSIEKGQLGGGRFLARRHQ
ncbi:MAG: methyltransferase domain-containing protein [Alphaproteobacteria bacterium]|nr:methyltransferase domain-containing protein [Alphaproteobacteria bacterium]